jgi:hypothetical protein
VVAVDVQDGFVQAGVGGTGQVLGGRRRADREGALAQGVGGHREGDLEFRPSGEGVGGDHQPGWDRESGGGQAGQVGGLAADPVGIQAQASCSVEGHHQR